MKTKTPVTWAAALLGCHLALTSTIRAEDWPQWGGNDPGRNMMSRAKGIPDSFEPGKMKAGTEEVDLATTKNVKWVAKLGSQSYGNPTVAAGKVFVGTNNDSPRDPQHKGDRSVLMTFDEKTGNFLWQFVVPKLASGKVNDWESLGLLSSPTVIGDRLYLTTSRCEIVCLDVNGLANGNDGTFKDEAQYVVGPGKPKATVGPKDADIIWRYDMMDELGVFPHNASNWSTPAPPTARTGRTSTSPRPTRRASSPSIRRRGPSSAKTTPKSARAFSTASGPPPRSQSSTAKNRSSSAAATASATPSIRRR